MQAVVKYSGSLAGKSKGNSKVKGNGQECPFHTVLDESAEPGDGGQDDGDDQEHAEDVFIGCEP